MRLVPHKTHQMKDVIQYTDNQLVEKFQKMYIKNPNGITKKDFAIENNVSTQRLNKAFKSENIKDIMKKHTYYAFDSNTLEIKHKSSSPIDLSLYPNTINKTEAIRLYGPKQVKLSIDKKLSGIPKHSTPRSVITLNTIKKKQKGGYINETNDNSKELQDYINNMNISTN